tara:strand:- start:16948 stop:17190 length:243 start_codon:yes stop_codon:yes gene_type:complete
MIDKVKKLLATGNFTHAEIAKYCGLSRSRITQIAGNTGRKQNTLTSTQWDELLAQYPYHTITYLAGKYTISRAAIYRKLK